MLKSPEPKLGQNAEELDAGWETAVAPPTAPRPGGVSVTPAAVATDELDDAWGELPVEPLLALRRAEPVTAKPRGTPASQPPLAKSRALPAAERPVAKTPLAVAPPVVEKAATAEASAASKPAATAQPSVARAVVPVVPTKPTAPTPAPRALSKKERRALERKQRAHATQKVSERKQSARAKRREEAQRLAEQRQAARHAAHAALKQRAREEKRATNKPRSKRAAADEGVTLAVPKSGTKREAAAASRTKGRPKKYSGGGYIVALIALITLATGLYAWSKR
ncbi:MAG TPA: hypothetical protein VLJ38_09995 [Polyangiaceae bacterium]|nr:hypothetical protein [Polyangiaceae bacterium]